MGGCKDPQGCRFKADRLREILQNVLPVAEQRWENVKNKELDYTKHAIEQMINRAVSSTDVQTVMEYGWPIEYFPGQSQEKFLIMGYTVQKRPLHLIVICTENTISLTTVYDPRTMPWKWENGYQVRKCFCKNEEGDV